MSGGITDTMEMKILLPHGVFANVSGVVRLVAETTAGSYGFLPNRLDCAASLVSGILQYETENGIAHYVAIDEGLLIKAGPQITLSVHNAIGDVPLGELHQAVKVQFEEQDETGKRIRTAMAKMERGFIMGLEKYRRQ